MKTRAPEPGERVVTRREVNAALYRERVGYAARFRKVVLVALALALVQLVMLLATVFLLHGSAT